MIALVVLGAALLAHAGVLRDLVGVWAGGHYFSYGFLVIPFSAWLLWEARHTLAGARPAWHPLGLALLAAAGALLGAGAAAASLTLKALALPLAVAGLTLLAVGPRRFRAVLFPIAFLAFVAPVPAAAVAALSALTQEATARFTHGVLLLLGVPVTRDALFLHLEPVTLWVSEACNGLRFLFAMTVLGTAVAGLTQLRTLSRLVIVAGAVALAVLGNLLRVASTAVLTDLYGAAAATGTFHVVHGKVVYALMLIPFFVLVMALRRRRPAPVEVTA